MMDADTPARAAHFLQQGLDAAGADRVDDAIACFRRAVGLQPGLSVAQANLGLLLGATGQHAAAEAPLRAALAALPANPALHNALGTALQALNRPAEAEACFLAALAVQAHFAPAHANLGLLLQDRGELELAIAHYRQALASAPDHAQALNNLGNCLRQQGALDEARETFERLLALRPHQLEAHCNLAQLKTYRPGDPQVDAFLAQRHRLPSLPEHGRIRYWFTAGKMLEDQGRFDESFAAYAEGNRLKRAQTPWDEDTQFDIQRRVVATFTRELLRRHTGDDGEPVDGPVPVFIVGMPRSGTSLLEQVLATLPGVHGAGELTDLTEVLQSAADDHPPGEFRFPESLAGYSTAEFRRLGRRYAARLRRLAPQATHVVDKLPANFIHLGLIHLMLPNARIVHAMRDPMDSCFSCYSQLFNGDNLAFAYDLQTLGRYWQEYDAMMRHWHAVLPPGRVLDLPYETLVADFEQQARRLVAHLGLPWDERCLGFHAHQRVVKTASVAQVRRPLYRSSVARWKAFERHLGPLQALVKPRP
jgi:Tfp pilus assembly protein PilF